MLKVLLTVAIAIGLAACDKGSEGKATGAGSSAAGTAAPAAGATTKLTNTQLDEAYKATGFDPYEKSVATATAKLGPPQKTDATSSTWYGVGAGKCYRLLLTKTKGNQTGTTDQADCGLK